MNNVALYERQMFETLIKPAVSAGGECHGAIRGSPAYNRVGGSTGRRDPAARSHHEIRAMPSDRRIRSLAVTQLALGLVAAVLAPVELDSTLGLSHILIVPLFASALGQAVLLALWGAASQASPARRLAGLVAGAVYLEALFAPDLRREFLGTATLTIVVISASLLLVRWLGVRITRQAEEGQSERSQADGLRFSIRGLMLFTAAVALLSAGARALQATPQLPLLLMVVWALCFVAVGLVALWAALGVARPQGRVPVVFALSPVVGVCFAYATAGTRAGWVYIILIMLLYPADLVVSLLVVRSCGYRLVGRAAASRGGAPGGGLDRGPSPLGRPVAGVASPEGGDRAPGG